MSDDAPVDASGMAAEAQAAKAAIMAELRTNIFKLLVADCTRSVLGVYLRFRAAFSE